MFCNFTESRYMFSTQFEAKHTHTHRDIYSQRLKHVRESKLTVYHKRYCFGYCMCFCFYFRCICIVTQCVCCLNTCDAPVCETKLIQGNENDKIGKDTNNKNRKKIIIIIFLPFAEIN